MVKYHATVDPILHALADPTRRHLVERLSQGPASVSELAAPLPMSLPGVLQHLGVLESTGLIRSQKVGRVRTCTLDPARLRPVRDWFEERRLEWESRIDRLEGYLADTVDENEKGN